MSEPDTYAVPNLEVEAAPDGMRIQVTGSIVEWPYALLRRTVPE